MDGKETIHARSKRLISYLDKLSDGEIDLAEMNTIIDREEASAYLPNGASFFDATRRLAQKMGAD